MLPTPARPLFFLDYDGTLAPIVDDPSKAVPHPDIPEILTALRRAHPVWIVTGRDVRALEAFLDLPFPVIGLHGAQQGEIGGDVKRLMPDDALHAIRDLKASVPDVEGLHVEDKDPSFAVHYRQADEDEALDQLETWVESMPEILDAIWGKKVVEVRPAGLTKGTAVRRIAADHPTRTPVYLGDDTTDEDAFEALQALRDETGRDVVTARIGDEPTRAQYRLSGPDEVAAYLRRFLDG